MNIQELLNIELPIVLASQSPRRRQLLHQLGLKFSIRPAHIDESLLPLDILPSDYVLHLAEKKADKVRSETLDKSIIIAADTIVVHCGKILNKPTSREDAIDMLNRLSNSTHEVFTGIALVNTASGAMISDVKRTEVTFRQLGTNEVSSYVDSGSPMDKAGAYGIQDDFGAVFVSNISGCYYNIVGLPIELLYNKLKEII